MFNIVGRLAAPLIVVLIGKFNGFINSEGPLFGFYQAKGES